MKVRLMLTVYWFTCVVLPILGQSTQTEKTPTFVRIPARLVEIIRPVAKTKIVLTETTKPFVVGRPNFFLPPKQEWKREDKKGKAAAVARLFHIARNPDDKPKP